MERRGNQQEKNQARTACERSMRVSRKRWPTDAAPSRDAEDALNWPKRKSMYFFLPLRKTRKKDQKEKGG